MLLHDGSLPVIDILTTRHSGEWLHSLILMFNASVQSNGSLPMMGVFTVQHSIKWLHRLILMFNASVRSINRGSLVTPRETDRH